MAPKRTTAKTWSIDEKVRVLGEASKLSGAQLTAMLQREGLVLAELEQWRLAVGEDKASVATTKRIRKLERELARKEKALAEAAALLVLKKKVGHLWEDADDRHGRRERQMILALISEAQAAGARLDSACRLVGLSTHR